MSIHGEMTYGEIGEVLGSPPAPSGCRATPRSTSCARCSRGRTTITDELEREIELLTGDGVGHLAAGRRFAAGPGTDAPLLAADSDGNSTLDIVMPGIAGQWDANTATVLLGNGRCGFTPAPGSPFPVGSRRTTTAG
jgi:hypothetical protein